MERGRQGRRKGRGSGRRGHGRLSNAIFDHGWMLKVSNRQVQVMSTLPLKAMSRLWGKFNELDIPYYLRVPGFKLYSFIFGVKLVKPRPIAVSGPEG